MNLIVAMDLNGVIGVNGKLPWHYPEDLGRFKAQTAGGILIMGRKTWESLPGKLPGRDHIILSQDPEYAKRSFPKGVYVETSIEKALERAEKDWKGFPVWLCGGADIYREALEKNLVRHMDVTFVPEVTINPGDSVTYFPKNYLSKWERGYSKTNSNDPRLCHFILDI